MISTKDYHSDEIKKSITSSVKIKSHKITEHTIKQVLISILVLLTSNSILLAQNPVDAEKERPAIENRDALYSKYLLEGDSVSIAAMYTSDGMMGCAKGPEILSSAGNWIRNGKKNDSRHVSFKISTLTADGDLLIETGTGEGRSEAGKLKYTFRYLVVWKKEDGVWKLYRDVVL